MLHYYERLLYRDHLMLGYYRETIDYEMRFFLQEQITLKTSFLYFPHCPITHFFQ
jgi:hypothetical protein